MYSDLHGTRNPLGTVGLAYNNVLNINVKTDGYTVTPPYENVVDCLARYHSNPICIDIYDWNHSQHQLKSGINQNILVTLAAYLDLFYTVARRWQTVRFDAPLITIIASMTKRRFPSSGTSLECVSIKQTQEAHDLDALRQFMSLLWSSRAPRFSQFSIDNYFAFDKQIFRDLPYSRLTHLEVESTVTAALVYEILTEAFGMVKCRVSDITGPGPSKYRPAAHAPNLEYLGLETDVTDHMNGQLTGGIVALLNKLVAPALTELRLAYEEAWNDRVFIDFYRRSGFQLEVLHLEAMRMDARQLARILSVSPTIHELFIRGRVKNSRPGNLLFTDELLQQFMFDPESPYLCPDLESLKISLATVEAENGWFRRMLRDRFKNSNLRQIKIEGADGISNKDLNALQVLSSYRMSVWLNDICLGM